MYKGLKKLGVFISCILLPLVVYGAPTSGATSYDSSWAGGHVSMMEDGYIASPADDRYDMGGSSFTVEFWVYADASYSFGQGYKEGGDCDDINMFFEYGKGWESGKTYHIFACSDEHLELNFLAGGDDMQVDVSYDWTDGQWHHIVGVFDTPNNKTYIYVDGEVQGSAGGTYELESKSEPNPIFLGARYNTDDTTQWHSSIKMDEFRLWNDARTALEIQQSMYKQLDGNETNLVAYYKFDEKYGNTIEDASQNPLNSTAYNLGGDDKWIYSNAAPSIDTIEEQFISEDTNITLLVSDPDNDELNITATLADTTLGDIQSNTLWEQIGGDITTQSEFFENSIAISKDSNRIVTGATNSNYSGQVRVFEHIDGNWTQLGSDIVGDSSSRVGSGVSIDADGSTIAVGAPNDNNVTIYDYNGTNWNQVGSSITSSYGQYGASVSLSDDGSVVAIGAPMANTSAGAATGEVDIYRFDTQAGDWVQLGDSIAGEFAMGFSGKSVSLSRDGTIIGIGAYGASGDKDDDTNGYTRVYKYNGSTWDKLGANITGEASDDMSGYSVSLSGDGSIIAIGAKDNDGNATNSGHVRVYGYDGSSWQQLGADIDGDSTSDYAGVSVSLSDDGKVLAFGAMQSSGGRTGYARIYRYNGTSWIQVGTDMLGKAENEKLGSSVSLNRDGTQVVLGGADVTRVYKLSHLLQISPNETTSGKTQATVTLQDGTHETNTTFNATFCQNGNCPPKSISLTSTTVDENAQTSTQVGTLSSEDEQGETHTYSFCGGTDDGSFSLDANALQTAEVFDYESKSSYEVCIRSTDSANNTLEKNYTITVNDIQEAPQIDSIDNMTIDTHISMGLNVFDPENDSFNLTASIEDSSLADVSISKKWQQVGAEINGENQNDFLAFQHGVSFSKDGKRVAVGAMYNSDGGNSAGHVRVYEQVDGNWVQLGANIDGKEATEFSGSSVSLSANGNRVAIGASGANKARVYEYDGNTWKQLGGDITETTGKFGKSISLSSDGNIVAIGAHQYTGDNKPQSGLVKIMQYDATTKQWVQLGDDIYGESASDQSGFSISLDDSGTVVAIGAYASDTQTGQVRVYKYESSSWTQLGADIDGEASGDRSGWSVALSSDGTIVAIGAYFNNGVNGSKSGHVRVYRYKDLSWTQLGADIDGEASGDESGHSVDLSSDGKTLAVGAMKANNTKGEVKIYNYNSESWEHSVTIDGQGTFSGSSISLSGDGDKVAVGAYPINANSGQVKVYASSDILNIAPKDSASGSTQITLSADDGTGTSTETFIATFCQNGVCPPTDISLSSLSIAENSKANEIIGILSSVDEGSDTHTYSFCGGANDAKFSLTDTALRATESFDYESSSSYEVCVHSTNEHDLSTDKIFTIAITDKPEPPTLDDIQSQTLNNGEEKFIPISAFDPEGNELTINSNMEDESLADINITKIWSKVGKTIVGEGTGDQAGYSVSYSGDGKRVAIAAVKNDGQNTNAGHVRVYELNGNSWNQVGADIDGVLENGDFGHSVSLSEDGNVVAIGAPFVGDKLGLVRIYKYDGTSWNLLGNNTLDGRTDSMYGKSVSLSSDGTIVAIGANGRDNGEGEVEIFEYDSQSTSWSKIGDLGGSSSGDYFGTSVSLSSDGKTVAIGAYGDNSEAGQVDIYKYNGTSWNLVDAPIVGEASGDQSGGSVSLSADGTIVAIGSAQNSDVEEKAGQVRVYKVIGDEWTQLGNDIEGKSSYDNTGWSVSLSADGTILAVGTIGSDINGSSSGDVKIYKYDGTSWKQIQNTILGGQGEYSGWSVSLNGNGDKVVIGSYLANSLTGHARVFALSDALQITPKTDALGQTNITVTADDGTSEVDTSFSVTFCQDGMCSDVQTNLSNTTIQENKSVGTAVGTLSSSDENSYEFSFCGTDDANFTIESNTLKSNTAFDYESKNSYEVCVRATDSENATFDKTFTIDVTDIDESSAGECGNATEQTFATTPSENLCNTGSSTNVSLVDSTYNWSCEGTTVGVHTGESTQCSASLESYSVEFDGTDYTDTVYHGNTLTKPEPAGIEGYTFGGWYSDSSYTDEFNFDSAITSDMTVYPKWIKNPPTFTTNLSNITIDEDSGVHNYEINATDVEGDDLNITVKSSDSTIVTVNQNWDKNQWQNHASYSQPLDFNLTTVDNANGEANVTIKVQDSQGKNTTKTFTVNLNPVNDAPTIAKIKDMQKQEDFASFDVNVSVDDIDKDDLNITATTASKLINISPNWTNSLNSATYESNQTLAISSVANRFGVAQVDLKVVDSSHTQDSTSFMVNIPAVLDFPNISSEKISLAEDFGNYNVTLENIDTGNSESVTITTTLSDDTIVDVTSPAGDVTTSDANLTFSSIENKHGSVDATITISDGTNEVIKTITLEVNPINDAPKISGTASKAVEQNKLYSFTPTASDVENDELSFSIVNKPNWANFDTLTGKLSGTPTANDVGTYANIGITLKDSKAQTALEPFNIKVVAVPVNNAPTNITLSNTTITENSASDVTVGTLSTIDVDVGDTHVYSFCGGTNDSNFTIESNTLKSNTAFDYESKNSYEVCVRATDSENATFDKTFTIDVTDIDESSAGECGNATEQTFATTPSENLCNTGSSTNVSLVDSTYNWSCEGTTVGVHTGESTQCSASLESYSVEFDGTDYTDTVYHGNTLTKPEPAGIEGYTFGGWYSDSSYTDEFNFDSAITSDMTVYPKWIKNPPTFTTNLTNLSIDEESGVHNYEINATDVEGDDLNITVKSSDSTIVTVNQNWDKNQWQNLASYSQPLDFNLTTVDNANGEVDITIKVQDIQGESSTDMFTITVNPVNDAPNLAPISNQYIYKDTKTKSILLDITDIDNSINELDINATYTNGNLIKDINFTDDNMTISIADTLNGKSDINVTVNDGEYSKSRVFSFNVLALKENDDIKDKGTVQVDENETVTVEFEDGKKVKAQTKPDSNNTVSHEIDLDGKTIKASSDLNNTKVNITENGVQTSYEDNAKNIKAEVNATVTGKASHELDVDGEKTSAQSDFVGAQTTIKEVNGSLEIETSVEVDSNTTVKVTAKEDGSAEHKVSKNGVESKATSKVKGAKTVIDESGNVDTSVDTKKSDVQTGKRYEAVALTDSNGETVTKFREVDTSTNQEENPEPTLDDNEKFPVGSEVEIKEDEDDNTVIHIQTKTPVLNQPKQFKIK